MIAERAEMESLSPEPRNPEASFIYLDHNATTPIRPEVLDAMLPYLRGVYANPNSVHGEGQKARKAVEEARAHVARLIGAASPDEIVFTSGGSESDALAVFGVAQHAYNRSSGAKSHIVTTEIEHEALHGACRQLAARGFKVTKVGVDACARVRAEDVADALTPDTALVSVMYANNEVGTVQPIGDIAEICRSAGVVFHSDAVQAVGKVSIDVGRLGLDLLSLSGHKINAPKGVGALYIRTGVTLAPVICGHQERNRRGGTENVASIIGLGVAAKLIRKEFSSHSQNLAALRDRLEEGVLSIPGAKGTCLDVERLPGTSHFCFDGVDGHHLVIALDIEGICTSSGPACSGGMTELSHVLKAMKVPSELGRGALRVTLGWGTTAAEIDRFLTVLPRVLKKLRSV